MERLDLSITPERPNIEAAIHFARYAICKNLVKGKRILDVACGEGYGSYMLKEAGAEYVVGVDVSQESVAKAERLFAKEGLIYKAVDVANLDTLFDANEFDIVISVETIEHLVDPSDFLKSIKRVAKPDGIIIISCPNDHWYYPQDDQKNPFHLKKYKLTEFQQVSTDVLGDNVQWSIGSGVFGFGSTPLDMGKSHSNVPGTWMNYMDVDNAYLVNGEQNSLLSENECSYFIGVWNAPDWTIGLAVFPLTMDDYACMVAAKELKNSSVNQQLALNNAKIEYTKELRRMGLKLLASQAECETMREANAILLSESETMREVNTNLRSECETMRVGYNRYIKLRRFVPTYLRSLGVKIFRFFRR